MVAIDNELNPDENKKIIIKPTLSLTNRLKQNSVISVYNKLPEIEKKRGSAADILASALSD